MKITRQLKSSSPQGGQRLDGASSLRPILSSAADPSSAVSSAGRAQPADAVSFLGVPEDELTPRVRDAISALMEEASELRLQLAEMRTRLNEMSALAHTDSLLGILNRRAFIAELNRTLARVDRHHEAAALAYFDLNNMKAINDRYGHSAGDAALAHVARVIADNTRQSDVFGRLGGDEFGVILPYTSIDGAQEKVTRLVSLIASQPISVGDEMITVTVTAGIAAIERGATAEGALAVADAAMYAEKES